MKYTAKGDCSTCARREHDCNKEMFFTCASSEYHGDNKEFHVPNMRYHPKDYYKSKVVSE